MDTGMDGLTDGRQIPESEMLSIRVSAVYAVRSLGHSPESVTRIFKIERTCLHRWLKQYDEDGYAALDRDVPPGATPLADREALGSRLESTVREKIPLDGGRDTPS